MEINSPSALDLFLSVFSSTLDLFYFSPYSALFLSRPSPSFWFFSVLDPSLVPSHSSALFFAAFFSRHPFSLSYNLIFLVLRLFHLPWPFSFLSLFSMSWSSFLLGCFHPLIFFILWSVTFLHLFLLACKHKEPFQDRGKQSCDHFYNAFLQAVMILFRFLFILSCPPPGYKS
jgi:hypothetical protein